MSLPFCLLLLFLTTLSLAHTLQPILSIPRTFHLKPIPVCSGEVRHKSPDSWLTQFIIYFNSILSPDVIGWLDRTNNGACILLLHAPYEKIALSSTTFIPQRKSQEIWIWISALPLKSYKTSGKSLYFSETLFPHPWNWIIVFTS